MISYRPPLEPDGRSGRFARRVISNSSCARRADRRTASESIPPDCEAPAIRYGKNGRRRFTVHSAGNISPRPWCGELDFTAGERSVAEVIPRDLNAARWFVDRHIEEGRDGRLAITYEGR